MREILLVLGILLLLAGCSVNSEDSLFCSYHKIDPLCEYQKSFGGYVVGKSMRYTHSSGYDFDMVVAKDRVYYRTSYGGFYENEADIPCNENGSTAAIRLRSVRLESEFPMFTIELEMDGDNEYAQGINAYIGQYSFFLDNTDFEENKNERSSLLDSLEINGHLYRDVAVINGVRHKESVYSSEGITGIRGSEELSQAKVYYTTKQGFLKIEFDDGSFIELKEDQK